MDYVITYYSGLRQVALGELRQALGDVEPLQTLPGNRHDALFFRSAAAPRQLLGLRSAENAFALVAEIAGVSVHRVKGLERLRECLAAADFAPAVAAVAAARGETPAAGFGLTLQLQGHHKFAEGEVHAMCRELLGTRPELGGYAPHHALNVRMQLVRDKGFLALQLPPRALHFRPYKVETRAGSLDPTVAAALARLAGAAPGKTFLDPLCGAGTIAIEAALMGASVRAGDRDPEALAKTAENAAAAGIALALATWDAEELPLPDGSVAAAAANLPYGKDIPLEKPGRFVRRFLGQLGRVLEPGGQAALLSTIGPLLARNVAENKDFQLLQEIALDLYGHTATIQVIRRRA